MQSRPIGDIVAVERVLEPEARFKFGSRHAAAGPGEGAPRASLKEMRRVRALERLEEAARLHSFPPRSCSTPDLAARSPLASMIDASPRTAQLEILRNLARRDFAFLERHRWIASKRLRTATSRRRLRAPSTFKPAFTFPRDACGRVPRAPGDD